MRHRRMPIVEGMESRQLLAAGVAAAAMVSPPRAEPPSSLDGTLRLHQGRSAVRTMDDGARVVTVPISGRFEGFGRVVGRWVETTIPGERFGRGGLHFHTARGDFSLSVNAIGIDEPRPAGSVVADLGRSHRTSQGSGVFSRTTYSADLTLRTDLATHEVNRLKIHLERALNRHPDVPPGSPR